MFGKNDDIASNGFRTIEEAAEPWAQPKKTKKVEKQTVEEVKEAVKESADNATIDASTPIEELEIEKNTAAEEPAEKSFDDEYMYDDYMDPEEEYTYDDADIPEEAIPDTKEAQAAAASLGPDAEKAAQAEGLCRWAAARSGLVVVYPGLGTVALLANEVYMIIRLARVYDVKLSTGAATGILSSLGATFIGQTIATLNPFPPLKIPIAVTVTYALGKAVSAWLVAGMPSSFDDFKKIFEEERQKSAKDVASLVNLECRNIPLGDETKKPPLPERAFDTVTSGVDYTGNKITDVIGYFATMVGDKLVAYKDEKFAEFAEKMAAEEERKKNLPESEKSLYANVTDNYEKTCDELKDAMQDAYEQVSSELKESITEAMAGTIFEKLLPQEEVVVDVPKDEVTIKIIDGTEEEEETEVAEEVTAVEEITAAEEVAESSAEAVTVAVLEEENKA